MFETFFSTSLSKWSLNVILLSTSGIASISLLSMKVEGAHPSLPPILTNHHPSAVFSLTWEQALPMLEYYWIINTMHIKSKWYHLTVKNKRKLGNTSLIFCYFTLHNSEHYFFLQKKKSNLHTFASREADAIPHSVCEISDSYILRLGHLGRFNVHFYLQLKCIFE